MSDVIPNAQLVVMAGAAHMPSMKQPEASNHMLREWLQTRLR